MNSNEKGKILKSWIGLTESAVIKDVATKGEHIDLCIEYLSKKRKMPMEEYRLFFNDVVQTHVRHLLSEKLVDSAESVIKNIQKDVSCWFYQFSCECNDNELRTFVLQHLKKKEGHITFETSMEKLKFYWDLLQQIKASEIAVTNIKRIANIKRINLESLVYLDTSTLQRITVELYFENRNTNLLSHVTKFVVWEFLLDNKLIADIVRWCNIQTSISYLGFLHENGNVTDLDIKYSEWSLEPKMYEHAVRTMSDSSIEDSIRNLFAAVGYFFEDENNQPKKVLQRICFTESFKQNEHNINRLNISQLLWESKNYYLLFRDNIPDHALDHLTGNGNNYLLNLICALKTNYSSTTNNVRNFNVISSNVKNYLENLGINFESQQIQASFLEFLSNHPTVATLNSGYTTGTLKDLHYIKHIVENQQENIQCQIKPFNMAYKLIQTLKGITLKSLKPFEDQNIHNKEIKSNQFKSLHFLDCLRLCRSSYAMYLMIIEQLRSYGQITRAQLFKVCESIFELALQIPLEDAELIIHFVAFCEMLGFDTQKLRSLVKLKYYLKQFEKEENKNDGIESILQQTERCMVHLLEENRETNSCFPLEYFKAVVDVSSIVKSKNPDKSYLLMQYYATRNNYWSVLVLLQFFDIPLENIRSIAQNFGNPSMREHLFRALCIDAQSTSTSSNSSRSNSTTNNKRKLLSKRQQARTKEKPICTTSVETMTSSKASGSEVPNICKLPLRNKRLLRLSLTHKQDIFSIIIANTATKTDQVSEYLHLNAFLECMQEDLTSNSENITELLRISVEQHLPVMSLMSVCLMQEDYTKHTCWCWLTWLSVITNQWKTVLRLSSSRNNKDFIWSFLEHLIRQNQIVAIERSFSIFFPTNGFVHLFRFMQLAMEEVSDERAAYELRLFCLSWTNGEIAVPLSSCNRRDQLMKHGIRLLLIHLQANLFSSVDQRNFLTCICLSGLSDITVDIDFCLLKEFFVILHNTENARTPRLSIDFIKFLQNPEHIEYDKIIRNVVKAGDYDLAVRLSTLLEKPITDIISEKWIKLLEHQLSNAVAKPIHNFKFPFDEYEKEVESHSLPPEILVNFFLYASARLPVDDYRSRYVFLQKALNVIKYHHLFPNESFDRDQIEYDMILSYLNFDECTESVIPYHSEYYEQIMLNERRVLYKSFMELKELAGIDDLNVYHKTCLNDYQKQRLEHLLHGLLNDGDIVQALRLQELFELRPINLRFVVFCMALAEGISSVYSMTADERHLLSDIEISSFSQFSKRTLYGNTGQLSDSSTTLEFEEIPSKYKQDTLSILQGITSKLKDGVMIAKRILCCYRAAMYLDKEYLDVLRTKDISVLLKSVAEGGCLHRLLVVNDILSSTHMNSQEIADLLALEITTAIIRPRFYIFTPVQPPKLINQNADLWGYDIDRDIHLFLELTPNRTKLGTSLLEYCNALKIYRKYQENQPFESNIYFERLETIIKTYGLPLNFGNNNSASTEKTSHQNTSISSPAQVLSHKKQNIIYVELLIKAHQAFIHECSMEGIACVLNRAKKLNLILAQAKSWSLIVRMLTGIGRYREMFFCFDTLIENEQFESLLGQFDEEKTVGLKQAILYYLRESCDPQQGKELFKLAAFHFLMYKDLAELWEQDAKEIIQSIYDGRHILASDSSEGSYIKLKCDTEMLDRLNQAMDYYVHATENYLLDNKLLLAQKSACKAELIAVQIDMVHKTLEHKPTITTPEFQNLCASIIQIQDEDQMKYLVKNVLSVSQSTILSRAHGYDINWSETIFHQFVLKSNRSYLNDFLREVDITDDIIENIAKSFQMYNQKEPQATTKQMEDNISELLDLLKSVTLKYKLSSILGLKSITVSLINDQTIYYLRDINYGRREENRCTL